MSNVLNELTDLSDWRIETWFEIRICECDNDHLIKKIGLYKDENTATKASKNPVWFEGKGKVFKILVVTQDGRLGFPLVDKNPVLRSDA